MEILNQVKPARAKKKIAGPHELDKVTGFWGEQKIDGQRYLIHTRDGGHRCTSRRISVTDGLFVEKSDRVPHLMSVPFQAESMLDCEFVSSQDIVLIDLPDCYWDAMEPHRHTTWLREKYNGQLPVYPHVSATTSIMGSSGPEAVSKQKNGIIWAYVFDILQFGGQKVLQNTQAARRRFLAKQFEDIDPETGMVLMPKFDNCDFEDLFNRVTDPGGEGLIFKRPDVRYDHAQNWFKWKKDFPVDAVLTGGFTFGTGKLSNLVGALEIGVYGEDGCLYPIGNISAIMDSEAKVPELTRQALEGELLGRVVECRHNGTQKKPGHPLGVTLRHPRFRRWRDEDKNACDCTLEALLAEL